MILDQIKIQDLERKYKLNLINSVSGIKPANLIGTISNSGQENVAIFSSVVHVGSAPQQLGFIVRPQQEMRDTYANIQDSGIYTINHIADSFIKKAHYTSAKLPRGESEFNRMNLDSEYIGDFAAPFVKDSVVKIGLKYVESLPISNGCTFVIGEILLLIVPDDAVNDLGQVDLEKTNGIGISGLNTYYNFKKVATLPYVRENEIPDFE